MTPIGQLRKRWGSPRFIQGAPPEIEIAGMGREVWLRIEDGSKGDNANYQLEGAD